MVRVGGMSLELEEMTSFVAAVDPFSHLPAAELPGIVASMTMRYARRGDTIVARGNANDELFIIRSGAVDIVDEEGTLLDRRDAGRCFGYSTLMGENRARYDMIAVEDSLLMVLNRSEFTPLAAANPDVARYFSSQSKRIAQAAATLNADHASDALKQEIGDFMVPNPVTVPQDVTIQEAARTMVDRDVSSLLIVAADERGQQRLSGIVTDRDLRRRVVAENLDITKPVTEIMTADPRSATPDTLAFEAMLTMAELRIHHLPVVDGKGQVVGIVTSADIMRLLRHDPIYLTADLARRNTPEELREVYENAGEVAVRFIERGASSEEVTGLLTVVADALARRLLVLGEEKLGPPPVPYAFVVLGSQGRRGMGLASDQDNALILDNAYDEAVHGEYFAALADFVCQGLATAGQPLCPGNMMASNPEWRMTEDQWINTFHHWITAPEPDALLHAQVFFDMRPIYGAHFLAENVHSASISQATRASRMHAHLAALAARREPPLGFFRGLVVDRSGEYANTLDVKKGGTAAVVQMARLYALAGGNGTLGTRQRLRESAGSAAVSEQGAENLIYAFDFLNNLSLRHQAAQIRQGETPNYHIDPQQLSKRDRENLRDAFQIIKNMQNALATKFPVRNI